MSILPGLLLAVCINAQAQQTAASCDPEGPALEQARELLRSTPLIDGHNDLPWVIREATGGDVPAYDLASDKDRDTDIPKLRAGLLGAQFWSVWIPGEIPLTDYGRH
jgi:membrane dipeptidase